MRTVRMQQLRADVRRHLSTGADRPGRMGALLVCLETQGVWASAVLRYGQWVYDKDRGLPGLPLKIGYRVLHKGVEIAAGISVPASADIGPGLYIGHFGQIIVHADTRAGRNLSLGQGVTLGTRGGGSVGAPVIGDDVYIGVGAKILGPVHIGDGARIGANAVVLDDVPAGATAVGIPARVVKVRGAP